ncbi:hypothetical protein ILYODFUR_020757 [Ilyodon furcidens]|uniref:Uncharacterized protein n=1 Tax=Ilyodon furcidens TaxID=33524 RepID=A0ABV0VFQ1_9TELE
MRQVCDAMFSSGQWMGYSFVIRDNPSLLGESLAQILFCRTSQRQFQEVSFIFAQGKVQQTVLYFESKVSLKIQPFTQPVRSRRSRKSPPQCRLFLPVSFLLFV